MNSNQVRRQWAERSGEFSPEYYAYYGPNETSESIRRRLDRSVAPDAAILELGCSSGRHLAHLHEHGYENLHGVDINADAFDVMADAYPALAEAGTFYVDAIEDLVTTFDDGRFDVVYSVETLQHIPPEEASAFEALSRLTNDLLLTVENEGEPGRSSAVHPDEGGAEYDFPLYYRNWNEVFTAFGLVEVDSCSTGRDTLRVFRRTEPP